MCLYPTRTIQPAKPERKKPGPKAGNKKAAVAEVPAVEKPAKGKPGRKKSVAETPATPAATVIETTAEKPAKTRKPRASKLETTPATPTVKGKPGRPKAVKEAPATEKAATEMVEKPKGKGRPPKSTAPSPTIVEPKAKVVKEKKIGHSLFESGVLGEMSVRRQKHVILPCFLFFLVIGCALSLPSNDKNKSSKNGESEL